MLENPFVLGLIWNLAIAGIIISFVFLISLIKKRILWKVDKLVALSAWLILWIVFLWFLPEVIEHWGIDAHTVWFLVLAWIFIFYTLELFLHWHHCKDLSADGHSHHDHEHENSPLIAFGTFFHNVVHGVVLFSAFSIDSSFGISTTLAVLTHAIPQNVANLLMNHKDVKYVYIAAFGWVFWALLIYPFQDFLLTYNFHILPLIAGWLLYTAMSDILPSFAKKNEVSQKALYLFFMVLWVFLFTLLQADEHNHEAHTNHKDEIHEEHELHIEESASKAAWIYVDQSDHFSEHEEHDDDEHEWHDHE